MYNPELGERQGVFDGVNLSSLDYSHIHTSAHYVGTPTVPIGAASVA